MAVPKKRHSKSKTRRRRLHIFLKKPALVKCGKCGHFKLPHTVCVFCGYYKGREVIDTLKKLTKKEKKKREKEIKTEEESKKEKPLSMEELSKK